MSIKSKFADDDKGYMFYKVPLLDGELFVNYNVTIQFDSFGIPRKYFLNKSPGDYSEDHVRRWLEGLKLKVPESFGDHKAHIFDLGENFVNIHFYYFVHWS